MKRLLLVSFLLAPLCGVRAPATASAAPADDHTLSPYFFVKSDDPALDQFPLKSSAADVTIVGVIARVRVTQVYRNEGKRAIEAVYVFPGSTRAAVHGLTMTIGERVITAKIEERQEARRQYDAARQAGQTASLLEQQRPNVFQMNVANVLPGDDIKVELAYTELLVPEAGVYEFVYPTVVGPRYSRGSAADEAAPAGRKWTSNPYLHQGVAPSAAFRFDARVTAGMPLKEVACASHREARIDFAGASRASVTLDAAAAADRDVVLRYRLADNRIETGLLLDDAGDERFFLCLVEPPARFAAASVPPREYVLIMDVSGSMNGFPIDTSKELLRNLLAKLRPADYFNVMFFSGASYALSPVSLQATEANKTFALDEIDRQGGGGGTELLPALQRAFELPRPRADISRVVAIATDGYVDVEREAFTLIRQHLNDTNVFAFGIGTSVNRHLIEGMARVGEGLPFVVLGGGEAHAAASRFLRYIESPLLTHVEVSAPGFDVYDLEPAKMPDVFAERPLVLVGKYRGEPRGSIVISGRTGQGRFERRIEVGRDATDAGNDVLKYLWARERVALLSDFATLARAGADERQQIVTLGLKYSLLTEFTSFVAIDRRVRRQGGPVETVKQPLPLPSGVTDLAVGGGAPATKAPATVAESVAVAGSAPLVAPSRAIAAQRLDTHSAAVTFPPSRTPIFRGAVIENRLQGRTIAANALESMVSRALAGAAACAGNGPGRGGTRIKIVFDAKGRVSAVESLAGQKSKDAAAFAACLHSVLRNALVLPAPAGGYLVVRIERIG